MPEPATNPALHMQQSSHNYDAYKHIELANPKYIDWEINMLFYSACKLVDARLIRDNRAKPSNHRERNISVRTEFHSISKEYRRLYELSIASRYERSVDSEDKTHALEWHRAITNNLAYDKSG